MKDFRLTAEELDTVVSVAYGGAAYRAGRRAQARTLSNLLRGKPLNGEPPAGAGRAGKA